MCKKKTKNLKKVTVEAKTGTERQVSHYYMPWNESSEVKTEMETVRLLRDRYD